MQSIQLLSYRFLLFYIFGQSAIQLLVCCRMSWNLIMFEERSDVIENFEKRNQFNISIQLKIKTTNSKHLIKFPCMHKRPTSQPIKHQLTKLSNIINEAITHPTKHKSILHDSYIILVTHKAQLHSLIFLIVTMTLYPTMLSHKGLFKTHCIGEN